MRAKNKTTLNQHVLSGRKEVHWEKGGMGFWRWMVAGHFVFDGLLPLDVISHNSKIYIY